MTSWKRGEKREDEGEKMMKEKGVANKVKGAALKVAGELEQGADNLVDRVAGKQKDLQGKNRAPRPRSSSTSSAKKTNSTRSKAAK